MLQALWKGLVGSPCGVFVSLQMSSLPKQMGKKLSRRTELLQALEKRQPVLTGCG